MVSDMNLNCKNVNIKKMAYLKNLCFWKIYNIFNIHNKYCILCYNSLDIRSNGVVLSTSFKLILALFSNNILVISKLFYAILNLNIIQHNEGQSF